MRDGDSEEGRGWARLSAENGIGGYCSVTLSRWENQDIGGFNAVCERGLGSELYAIVMSLWAPCACACMYFSYVCVLGGISVCTTFVLLQGEAALSSSKIQLMVVTH